MEGKGSGCGWVPCGDEVVGLGVRCVGARPDVEGRDVSACVEREWVMGDCLDTEGVG